MYLPIDIFQVRKTISTIQDDFLYARKDGFCNIRRFHLCTKRRLSPYNSLDYAWQSVSALSAPFLRALCFLTALTATKGNTKMAKKTKVSMIIDVSIAFLMYYDL